MGAYLLDWLSLLVRWFHLAAGIAWIGASFYFVWLDNNLQTPPAKKEDVANGVFGELWSVHGGGFYHNQKYLTGPRTEPLTHDLHWFKWEAYSTWLSGIAMLAIVYWAGAGTYLIDKDVLDLTPPAAIAISFGSLVVGWFAYDALCRMFAGRQALLGAAVFAFLVAAAYGLAHLFSPRAAYMHVGAIVGTIMVANVLFVIIPGQRKMLAQIRAGREPDPAPGRVGKIRSVHNTYLTLPVLFIMISSHYPMTYESPYAWAVLAALSLASVLVREFFLRTHRKRITPGLLVAAAVVIVAVVFAAAPRARPSATAAVAFERVAPIFAQRCAACHAARPTQPGIPSPPDGVLLDSPGQIRANARRIYQQAVATHNMPLGNATRMTAAERELVGAWIDGGAKTE
jgi:uncharacterized membrane protein